jgi:hypothetical protein
MRERLILVHAKASAQEATKMCELLGEGRIDTIGTTSLGHV